MAVTKYPLGVNYDYPLILKKLLLTPLDYAPTQEIIFGGRRVYDYRGYVRRLNSLASGLNRLGVTRESMVAVLEYNSHRYLECLFAIPMMGATLHTINWRQSPEYVAYAIEHSQVDTIIINSTFLPQLEKIKSHLDGVKRIILIRDEGYDGQSLLKIDAEYEQIIADGFDSYDFPDLDENTVATLYYTAGTTARPKGVFFSHRQIVLHTMALGLSSGCFHTRSGFSAFDTYMPLTPLYHEHGWGMPYLATMVGARQVYPGRHNPHSALELIRDQKVTFSHCLPTMLHMMLSDPLVDEVDLSKLKIIVSGAKISRQLAQDAMSKGLHLYSGYGMSEACPMLSVSHLKPSKGHTTKDKIDAVTSAGIPAPLVELKVVDHLGTPLPHDGVSVGEIVVRSPWLTKGYYKDPDRAHDLWREGWLHTGDIGFIDTDGYVHITERTKDAIKTGGEWISAAQLENMVRKHKAVAEAAVVGVPDEKWGEKPLVLVVIKNDLKDQVCEDDLKSFMQYFVDSGEISKYSLPDRYLIVDEIPTTGVRKVNFRMIRENLGVE